MSRPNSLADLADYEKSAMNLVSVSAEVLDINPAAASRIYSAFALIMEGEYDFTVSVENGNLVRSKTAAELNRALDSAQSIWDRGKKEYETIMSGGGWPAYDYSMRTYCLREGLDVPEKDAE